MAIQSEEPLQSTTPLTAESILKEHANLFRGDGKLEGDLHLEIDLNVSPVQLPTRKVPIAIKEKLKEELDRLEGLNITTPVNVPTSWISATVITLKKNGNVRLCVDQKIAQRLSEITTPLHELTKNDNEHGAALEETKKTLSTTPVLKYFDPGATPTLQCDASMHGLRACLMQDGHPVAYASRSLTPTEVQYAQIEKELLAIVFAMEKFETYPYGRKVLVESDHKPLEAILKKRLLNAPKRLQRMLLRLQRYEFEVSYKRGTSLHMADPLSRAYLSLKEATEDQEDVMTVSETRSPTEIEAEQVNMLQYLPVKDETLCQIQNLTQEDAILKTLVGVIKQGWPESKLRLPPQVQDYFPFKEELTLQNGVIFKGDRVIIPFQMRAELKMKLHSSHLGVQACQRRAREASYWPGMYKEIEEYCMSPSVKSAIHTTKGSRGRP